MEPKNTQVEKVSASLMELAAEGTHGLRLQSCTDRKEKLLSGQWKESVEHEPWQGSENRTEWSGWTLEGW